MLLNVPAAESRSADGGASWAQGQLPGITVTGGGGTYERLSDPSVAYAVGPISSIPILKPTTG